MARQFSTGTKFGSEKGKVQNPARIPPQTPPAGGKKAEAEAVKRYLENGEILDEFKLIRKEARKEAFAEIDAEIFALKNMDAAPKKIVEHILFFIKENKNEKT